jgi:hypothetical protein
MARSKNVKEIVVPARIRSYKYRARVCLKTGRVLGVRAGCRRWSGFTQAENHYRGLGKYGQCPSVQLYNPDLLISRVAGATATWQVRAHLNTWSARQDAIATLKLLKRKVERLQNRIRRPRRAR